MYPIGSKVRVLSVDHLGRNRRPTRLIGRTGTVTGHDEHGYNEVAGLSPLEKVTGRWMFADEHLTPAA